MFDRKQIKSDAKQVLSQNYWWMFLTCLIYGFLSRLLNFNVSFSGSGYSFSFNPGKLDFKGIIELIQNSLTLEITGGMMVVTAVMGLLSVAYSFFVVEPLSVGFRRYMLNVRKTGEASKVSTIFSAFSNGYLKVCLAMFTMTFLIFLPAIAISLISGIIAVVTGFPLFVFLSVLSVIPSIILFYVYLPVPYLLAENPDLGIGQALRMSRNISNGHKWDMFVLGLSFIGWFILGLMACGIGTVFVVPYAQAAEAEAYIVIRNSAIRKGAVNASDIFGKPEVITENTEDF